MNEPNKYHIDSFDKLCNVATPENVQRLAIDLAQWLIHYTLSIDQLRKNHPKETAKKTNSKIAKGSFVWVDDNKNDILSATVEDKDAGQIHTVDFKMPNSEQNVQGCDTTGDDSSTGDGQKTNQEAGKQKNK